MGPRAGLGAVEKRKIPSPRRQSNPDHTIVQPIAESPYGLSYTGDLEKAWRFDLIHKQKRNFTVRKCLLM
jgi:hypothetical protein